MGPEISTETWLCSRALTTNESSGDKKKQKIYIYKHNIAQLYLNGFNLHQFIEYIAKKEEEEGEKKSNNQRENISIHSRFVYYFLVIFSIK